MSLTSGLLYRQQPEYTEEPWNHRFKYETEFDIWLKSIASQHATWNAGRSGATHIRDDGIKKLVTIPCDHHGSPRSRPPGPSQRKRKPSTKVNCPANIMKQEMLDGSVEVSYYWIHKNHNPVDIYDLIESRIPIEIKT
ncbi:hypothetical protein BC941DRAFT_477475 [Chlamydoabsidia padenii]|nr:hypothetical protein BC941DRAFT_477475 [Chlamydoabsidia padenii]